MRREAASDHAFTYRHPPLCLRYCGSRLYICGRRCGVRVTPYQLRHSYATLLLSAGWTLHPDGTGHAGAHRHVGTTLGYARLYDGAVAAHYYRAMGEVEERLELVRSPHAPRPVAVSCWRWWTNGISGCLSLLGEKTSVMTRVVEEKGKN